MACHASPATKRLSGPTVQEARDWAPFVVLPSPPCSAPPPKSHLSVKIRRDHRASVNLNQFRAAAAAVDSRSTRGNHPPRAQWVVTTDGPRGRGVRKPKLRSVLLLRLRSRSLLPWRAPAAQRHSIKAHRRPDVLTLRLPQPRLAGPDSGRQRYVSFASVCTGGKSASVHVTV